MYSKTMMDNLRLLPLHKAHTGQLHSMVREQFDILQAPTLTEQIHLPIQMRREIQER